MLPGGSTSAGRSNANVGYPIKLTLPAVLLQRESMLPGGSHQRRPKHVGEAHLGSSKSDAVKAGHARIQLCIVTWLFATVLLIFASRGKKHPRTLLNVEARCFRPA